MLDKGRGLAGLKGRDEPFRFVSAAGRAAEPDAVAADDDEVVWHIHRCKSVRAVSVGSGGCGVRGVRGEMRLSAGIM